jgi:archaellum component FlaC
MDNKQPSQEVKEFTHEILKTYYALMLKLIKDREKMLQESSPKTNEDREKINFCLETLKMATEVTNMLLDSVHSLNEIHYDKNIFKNIPTQ